MRLVLSVWLHEGDIVDWLYARFPEQSLICYTSILGSKFSKGLYLFCSGGG